MAAEQIVTTHAFQPDDLAPDGDQCQYVTQPARERVGYLRFCSLPREAHQTADPATPSASEPTHLDPFGKPYCPVLNEAGRACLHTHPHDGYAHLYSDRQVDYFGRFDRPIRPSAQRRDAPSSPSAPDAGTFGAWAVKHTAASRAVGVSEVDIAGQIAAGLDAWETHAQVAQRQHTAEVSELRAEVREWLCAGCRTVYPGPPQPGARCVICPHCGGDTAPRERAERREEQRQHTAALAERDGDLERLREALRWYADVAHWRWDATEGAYTFTPGFAPVSLQRPWQAAENALAAAPQPPQEPAR